ncbi:MAG: peptide ABC transporter substrate-binding protein [Simkaniaceae bacterium]|nr:peptide ABC transporter substrate-binding protein [Simkaniaceae bacterium]
MASDHSSITVTKMFLDGLLRQKPNDDQSLSIAESFEVNDDSTKYIFHLRDVKWSDGTPVTAMDFEETWKKVLDPSFPAPFAFMMYVLKNGEKAKQGQVPMSEIGVTAVDAHTLVVELEYPANYFTQLLATQTFLPYPDRIAKHNERAIGRKGYEMIGNGPFLMSEWKNRDVMTFEKNQNYWDANVVGIDGVEMNFVNDQSAVLEMFEQGDIHWVGDPLSTIPEDCIEELESKSRLINNDVAGLYYYVFNTKRFPFNNEKMRKAFSLAMNRKEIIEHVTQKKHQPALRLLPNVMFGEKRELFKDNDLEEAKRLFSEGLKELGIRHNEFPVIPIHFNNTFTLHYKIAQAVQQQWRDVFNIKVELANREWKVYLDEIAKEEFHVARMGGIAIYNDPYYFLEQYMWEDNGMNHARWSSPEFKKYIKKAVMASSKGERKKNLLAAEDVFIEHMPIAPIFFYNMSYMKNNDVKEIFFSEIGQVDYKWARFVEQ